MSPELFPLLNRFFSNEIGADWQERSKPSVLTAWRAVESLWPMNDVFRQHHAQVSSLAYVPSFEAEADLAIEGRCFDGARWEPAAPSPFAWRVLLERHLQCITLLMVNHQQGNEHVMTIPDLLPQDKEAAAAMLFFQWRMKLPFPVADRAGHRWPEGGLPASLSRH